MRLIPPRRRLDEGSALMLMPACVLVVLLLASIAVDMSLVHLRQRQAMDAAASAANDAVTAGVDAGLLRQGQYRLDATAAHRIVGEAIRGSEIASLLTEPPQVAVSGDSVEVVLRVQAQHLFSGIIPGAPDSTVVTASASATAMAP